MKIAPLNYANARKAGEEEKGEVDIVEGGGEGGENFNLRVSIFCGGEGRVEFLAVVFIRRLFNCSF